MINLGSAGQTVMVWEWGDLFAAQTLGIYVDFSVNIEVRDQEPHEIKRSSADGEDAVDAATRIALQRALNDTMSF